MMEAAGSKSYKRERLRERVIQEVNKMLRTESSFKKNLGFVTISNVDISKDLSHAILYWDTHDKSIHASVKETLEAMTGQVRKYLAGAIQTKKIPVIKFQYNSQFDSEQAIENILKAESNMGKTY